MARTNVGGPPSRSPLKGSSSRTQGRLANASAGKATGKPSSTPRKSATGYSTKDDWQDTRSTVKRNQATPSRGQQDTWESNQSQAKRQATNPALGAMARSSVAGPASARAMTHKQALSQGQLNVTPVGGAPQAQTLNKLMDGFGVLHDSRTPLNQMPAFQPGNARPAPADNPRVYVNGIQTDDFAHRLGAQQLANATGQPVIAFRNPTNGFYNDLFESLQNKVGASTHEAMALAGLIGSYVTAGRSLTIDAHSQGAIIVSDALNRVADMLRTNNGMSSKQIERALSNITVVTYGGAAQNYIDGPKYNHKVDPRDPVPAYAGVGVDGKGARPGAGAKFDEVHGIDWRRAHDFSSYLQASYGPHAVPGLHVVPGFFDSAFARPVWPGGSFGFGPFGIPDSGGFSSSFSHDDFGIARRGVLSFGLNGVMGMGSSWGNIGIGMIGVSGLGPGGFDLFGAGALGGGGWDSPGIGSIGVSGLGPGGFDTFGAGALGGGSWDSLGVGSIGVSGLGPGGFDSFGAGPIGGGSWDSDSSANSGSSWGGK